MPVSPIHNPYASHPTFKIIKGGLNANPTLSSASDVLYPFAFFENQRVSTTHIAFEGEMVQTSPGRGEFVSLLAFLNKTQGIFELGEKFLGNDVWEQQMFDEVNSMNTEQRHQVYRRIFTR